MTATAQMRDSFAWLVESLGLHNKRDGAMDLRQEREGSATGISSVAGPFS